MNNLAMIGSSIVLVIAGVFLAWPPLAEFLAVDSCLDMGGSFDYDKSICDFRVNHPYQPYPHVPYSIAAAIIIGIGVILVLSGNYRRLKNQHPAP